MFFLFLIDKLEASSESVTLWVIDEGKITDKDFEHGVFELVTKDGQHIVVDDPGQTIILRPRGSGIVVDRVANDPAHMAELLGDYQRAYVTFAEGLQDPFLQQLIKTNSSLGSGTLFANNLGFLGGSNAVVVCKATRRRRFQSANYDCPSAGYTGRSYDRRDLHHDGCRSATTKPHPSTSGQQYAASE